MQTIRRSQASIKTQSPLPPLRPELAQRRSLCERANYLSTSLPLRTAATASASVIPPAGSRRFVAAAAGGAGARLPGGFLTLEFGQRLPQNRTEPKWQPDWQ